jgi:prophage antirepressor-like protein
MNDLQIFSNEQFGQIRTVDINNKTYFVGIDVAKILGYKNPNDAISRHCKGYVKHAVPTNSGIQQMNVITEGDIFRLTSKSELPGADKFESWVFDDVIPSIRKHGMYATEELLDNPDLLIAAATKLKEEKAARLQAEKQRDKLIHQNKLYTTSEIAKELGLSSATKLNNLLAEKKIQYKQNNTWLLYSKYSEKEYVSIKQDILDNGKIIYDRKWTGLGRDFILELLKKED